MFRLNSFFIQWLKYSNNLPLISWVRNTLSNFLPFLQIRRKYEALTFNTEKIQLDTNPLSKNTETNNQFNGVLAYRVVAMPANTNSYGDIFGGWLLSQVDLAVQVCAQKLSGSRAVTVQSTMRFLKPVKVGDEVSIYVELLGVGRSSMNYSVHVYSTNIHRDTPLLVCEGQLKFVAIDQKGCPYIFPKNNLNLKNSDQTPPLQTSVPTNSKQKNDSPDNSKVLDKAFNLTQKETKTPVTNFFKLNKSSNKAQINLSSSHLKTPSL